MTGVTLQQADEGDLSYVEDLLESNGLPSADVAAKPDCFYVGYDDEDPIGVGGVETYGTSGLLRPVVVEQSARGRGFGTAICEALEVEARRRGVETLYLLTTAADFFTDRGYVETERAAVPAAIRETEQFADLCPSTATCLRKSA